MNKKNIIIFAIAILLLIVAGYALNNFLTYKKVTINLAKSGITAEVYKSDPNSDEENYDQKIATLTTSGDVRVQAGKYYVIPKGKDFDETPVMFIIKDSDMSVTVNPAYSNSYLQSKVAGELAAIQEVIVEQYPAIISDFKINPGKLYLDGSWYGTTMVQNAVQKNNGDVYRLVLRKEKNNWKVAASPKLVLTRAENKDVPEDILSDLNRSTGYQIEEGTATTGGE